MTLRPFTISKISFIVRVTVAVLFPVSILTIETMIEHLLYRNSELKALSMTKLFEVSEKMGSVNFFLSPIMQRCYETKTNTITGFFKYKDWNIHVVMDTNSKVWGNEHGNISLKVINQNSLYCLASHSFLVDFPTEERTGLDLVFTFSIYTLDSLIESAKEEKERLEKNKLGVSPKRRFSIR